MQDPICGMPVQPSSPFAAEHEGQTFRFCSAFCREAFLRDPGRALARPPPGLVTPDERTIAYFSMEIALDPRMPTYAGGLGVLAGDRLRSCADLGIPVVAVTLLHRDGYFRQSLDHSGKQQEAPEAWPLAEFVRSLAPVVKVTVEGRPVHVRAFRYDVAGQAGRIAPVLLLDTDLPENVPADRSITDRLYGGDRRHRSSIGRRSSA